MATAVLTNQITSGTAQLQRTINATPSSLGTADGSVVTYVTTAHALTNLALYWQGALYKLTADGVRRSIDDGVTWQTVLTLTGTVPVASNNVLAGPYIVYNNGIPRIIIAYTSTGNLYRYASSLTGLSGSWTDVSTGLTGASANIGCFPVVYRSTLMFGNENSSQVYQINPFAATVAQINCNATCPFMFYLCVWNDIPYVTGRISSSWVLTSLSGGTPVTVLTIATGFFPMANSFMWVDPTSSNLIAIGQIGFSGGWQAYEITSSLVNTPRTSAMLTGTGFAASLTDSKLVGIFYDQETNPGGVPSIYMMLAGANTLSTAVGMWKYNGPTSLMGNNPAGPTSNANDSGGVVQHAWADKNIGGERFFTPRPVGVDGASSVTGTGKVIGVGVSRRKFRLDKPRSQVLAALGPSASHNLSTTPLNNTPVRAGFITIRGVVSATNVVAQDDGSGSFPVSTLLPAGGTINYTNGTMTGVTATLDAGSQVEALYIGGTSTVQWYRSVATNEYPASTTKAPLTNPTSGTISSDDNINCLANGSEQQVDVDMTGILPGTQISINPRAVG